MAELTGRLHKYLFIRSRRWISPFGDSNAQYRSMDIYTGSSQMNCVMEAIIRTVNIRNV